jgi:hypothetical protein
MLRSSTLTELLGDTQMFRLLLVVLFVVPGCAAGDPRFTLEDPAGFWMGLWHGLIACISLIVGIFYDSVEIYERHNSGGWYDLGFLIGVTVFAGSGHQGQRRWRCRSKASGELPSAHIPSSGKARLEVSWSNDDSEDTEAEPV